MPSLFSNSRDAWSRRGLQRILDIVFSDFRLNGVSFCYEMRTPFAL